VAALTALLLRLITAQERPIYKRLELTFEHDAALGWLWVEGQAGATSNGGVQQLEQSTLDASLGPSAP